MVVNIRKKNRKFRGSHTHGWGAKKKHRGAGHRGGRGNAGSGKRADSKKPTMWKLGIELGRKKGFHSVQEKKVTTINVGYISLHMKKLISTGIAKESNGIYELDLAAAGYDKLLSKGTVAHKLKITIPVTTKNAKDKIAAFGGEVIAQISGEESSAASSEE